MSTRKVIPLFPHRCRNRINRALLSPLTDDEALRLAMILVKGLKRTNWKLSDSFHGQLQILGRRGCE